MESSNTFLRCERCNSENVQIQLLNQIDLENKKAGCLWWILIGWWWVPFKWIFFTLLAFVLKVLKPKNYKIKNRVEKFYICNTCGHHWKPKN